MPDIAKQIMEPGTLPDVLDRKHELAGWSREGGERVAVEEGVVMTAAHWKVVDFLRDYFVQHGPASSGRELAKALSEAFAAEGGSRYLNELFIKGPVAQGCRIGGLPVPPYTEDKSFGSVM